MDTRHGAEGERGREKEEEKSAVAMVAKSVSHWVAGQAFLRGLSMCPILI